MSQDLEGDSYKCAFVKLSGLLGLKVMSIDDKPSFLRPSTARMYKRVAKI